MTNERKLGLSIRAFRLFTFFRNRWRN